MYKVASDRRQSALHKGRIADWVNGDERLTIEQQYKQFMLIRLTYTNAESH
jgi:hypothetical protein